MHRSRTAPVVVLAALFASVPLGVPAQEPAKVDAPPPTADSIVKKPLRQELEELLVRGADPVPIHELVEETIDDLVEDLGKLDAAQISPMAVRSVQVSPNLKASFAREFEARVTAAMAQGTKVRQVHCHECRAMRSRVENAQWVVSLGPVRQADLRRLAEELSVKTFLELDFAYSSGTNTISTQARLVRGSDGAILWAESYDSDGTTAAILRGRDRLQSRDERKAELERLLEKRPYYGQSVSLGMGWIPYKSPTLPVVTAMVGGYRIYEQFGPDRRWQFGLNAEGTLSPFSQPPVLGAFIGGQLLRQLTAESLLLPDLRVGGSAGGFLAGTEGNTFFVQADAELLMKFRFAAGVSVFYMIPTTYLNYELGGFGAKARISFVW